MSQGNDSIFCSFSPVQFVVLATVLGLLLTRSLNADEQDTFGNFFTTIGQVLQTTASQLNLLENNCNSNKQALNKINDLKQQICELEKEIKGC